MTEIPIRDLFYMLCYAWDILELTERQPIGSEQVHHPLDLLAFMLQESCQRLIKRGITSEYVAHTEIASGIKGKVQFAPTIQKSYHRTGRMVCETDEYSLNNVPNQIIRSTLFFLSGNAGLSHELKNKLMTLEQKFYEVDLRPITERDFRSLHLHRQNRHYTATLRVCELIWQHLIPTHEAQHYAFQSFYRSEQKMRTLFESFVRNFYKREVPSYQVWNPTFRWCIAPLDGALDKNHLPTLRTDTVLIGPKEHIIIETKFVPEVFAKKHHGNQEKLRSNHLYQLMSYLENYRRLRQIEPRGILLYPTVGYSVNLAYRIWDMDVQIFTIDLAMEWQEIHRTLLGLLEGGGIDHKGVERRTS